MAFLWMESFDSINDTTQLAQRYVAPSALLNTSISATGGRRGTKGLTVADSNNAITKTVTPGDTKCIVGIARKQSTTLGGYILRILDANDVVHVTLTCNADGSIQAWRGDTSVSLGVSAAGVLSVAAGYYYIEAKVVIDDSAGSVVVRVTGVGAPVTVLNLTSIDTRNAGLLGWSKVKLSGTGTTGGPSVVDDWYIFDGTGTENNDFLGDARVDAHYPNAAGSNNGSTPSTGTDRSLTVDETTPNDDTDYNTLTAVGDKDTYNLQNLINAGVAPKAVQITLRARKTDAGAGALTPVTRIATDVDGTAAALDVTYGYLLQPMNRDPDGNVWTEANFNTLQVGAKRTA